MFEPFEEAFLHRDHRRHTARMKFVRQDVEVELPRDHRIFSDAIRSRVELDHAAYERGSVQD